MKKILILNSCETLWFLYEKELESEACSVTTRSCRSNYLQEIRKIKPDLIITDNLLPVEKQEFILNRIRKNYRELPILVHMFPSGNRAALPGLPLFKSNSLSELKHKTTTLLTARETPPFFCAKTYAY